MYSKFLKFVNSFEIIILLETHVTEENTHRFGAYFVDFELRWIPAIKLSKFGRASGGCLIGYKKSIAAYWEVKFEVKEACNVLILTLNKEKIVVIPVYLNRRNWGDDFGKVQRLFVEDDIGSFIIVGDFNARVGNLQELPEEAEVERLNILQKRVSKDSVVDGNGRKLVEWLDDIGGIILNGRKTGDLSGEWTYVDTMGKSVNDLAISAFSTLMDIESFKVEGEIYSDHFPVVIKLKSNRMIRAQREKGVNLLPKLLWREGYRSKYKKDLENVIGRSICANDNETAVANLTEMIKSTVGQYSNQVRKLEKKQEWYDWECEKLRKKSFKWMQIFRSNNEDTARTQYLKVNKEYKSLCLMKKQTYNLKIARELIAINDAKQWWKFARKFWVTNCAEGIHVDLNELKFHFYKTLNTDSRIVSIEYAEPYIINEHLDADFRMEELVAVLHKAKEGKAPGEDRIPVEFYKNAPVSLLERLLDIFNDIYKGGKMPVCFKKSIIFPLHKKGDRKDAGNYRGISFVDSVVKVYTNILLNRLHKWLERENILHENQAGFRRGYSTVDNIFILQNIVALKLKKKEKVYAFFVDFKTAFDNVPRNKLFYKLFNAGLSTKFVRNIMEMYRDTASAVWDGKELSDWFYTKTGVKQGCAFSPDFFAIFLNDVVDCVGGGVEIGEIPINILMYADDIILLASTPEQLQEMIDKLVVYCSLWDLKVNMGKSGIMIFGGGRRSAREKWSLGEKEIAIVSDYKYLGIVLTPRLSMQKHLKERLKTSKVTISSVWKNLLKNKDVNVDTKVKVFESCSRSVLCYGAQVWGYKEYEVVERLQRYFIKKLIGLPDNTPSYMLLLETESQKLFAFTFKLHANYVLKCLSLNDNRFPKILAKEIIRENIFWYAEWNRWLDKFGLSLDLANTVTRKMDINNLVMRVSEYNRQLLFEAARLGVRHDLYNQLCHSGIPRYFSVDLDIQVIRIIFRARGGLLGLNTQLWNNSNSMICSLCNINEPEDMVHFVGICPILKSYRLKYLGSRVLNRWDVIDILNGRNWMSLYGYLRAACALRQALVAEFNF